jgi:hypothetical protein
MIGISRKIKRYKCAKIFILHKKKPKKSKAERHKHKRPKTLIKYDKNQVKLSKSSFKTNQKGNCQRQNQLAIKVALNVYAHFLIRTKYIAINARSKL